MNPLGSFTPINAQSIARGFAAIGAALRDAAAGISAWASNGLEHVRRMISDRTAAPAPAAIDPRTEAQASAIGSKAEVPAREPAPLGTRDFERSAADVSEPSSQRELDSAAEASVTWTQSSSGRADTKHARTEPGELPASGPRTGVRAARDSLQSWLMTHRSSVPGQRYRIFTGSDQAPIATVVKREVSGELRQLLSELTAPKRRDDKPAAPTPQALVAALLQVGDNGRTRLARLLGDVPRTLANEVYGEISSASQRDGTEFWAVNNLIFVNGVAGEIANMVNVEDDAAQRAALESTMRVFTDVFRAAICAGRDPRVRVPVGCETAVSYLRPELDRLIGIPASRTS